MTDTTQFEQDLHFVRQAVARRNQTYRVPAPIAILWAIYVLVGYTLLDIDPKIGGMFLMIAGIIGGIVSGFIGQAYARREGDLDRAEGIRQMLHWGSIFIAITAIIALSLVKHLDGQTMGQFIALVVGVVYFLGGVHFDRNFLWLGLLLMGGAIVVGFIPRYPWTALGVLIAGGLVVPLLFRRAPDPGTMPATTTPPTSPPAAHG